MVTTIQKVIFPNFKHSVQHVSILKFLIFINFYKKGNPIRQHNQKPTATIT